MASIQDYISGSGAAAIAYRNALNQSKDTVNTLFRSYGWNMPGANGYSVESAQGAFDPNKLFDVNTGGLDLDKVKAMAGELSYGGKGVMADIARGGGAAEADVALGLREAGIARGGLAEQRRRLVEAQTGKEMTGAKEQFLAGLAGAYAPIGTAYQDVLAEKVAAEADTEGSSAEADTTPNYTDTAPVTPPIPVAPIFPAAANTAGGVLPGPSRGSYTVKGNPTGNVPRNPKPGQTFKGRGGVSWVYRGRGPKGAGWYKKGA